MRLRSASAIALVMVLLVTSLGWVGVAGAAPENAGRKFFTTMDGASEAPGPGDPDGSGTALIVLNHGQRTVCFELAVFDIEPATAAHIHVGAVGVPGPVVVPLTPPTDGFSSGCVEGVDRALIKAIIQNPDNYYVNVHNAEFPGGAVRGQLVK